MKAFTPSPDGSTLVAELDMEERMVVARIVADVGLLLTGENFGMEVPVHEEVEDELFRHLRGLEEHLADPQDPAVLRLLPNAAPTDREVAQEFRRLTEGDLRDLKVSRLRRIWEQLSEDGPEWVIGADEAMATAGALTDVRLVLASRLRLETDDDARRLHEEIDLATQVLESIEEDEEQEDGGSPIDPERVWLGMLYDALTWLQESLMTCGVDQGGEDS